jgi:tRNA dimethylallyltransferase
LHELGADHLYQRLRLVDPDAAAVILPGNERRIVRALEVIELQGSFTATLPTPQIAESWVLLGLDVPRPILDQRIEQRVHHMWDQGLVDEVRELVTLGLREGVTASRALGYAQVLKHMDGAISAVQAREQTVVATRRFARRQLSWFRRDPRIQWLSSASDRPSSDLLDAALGAIGSTSA